MTDSRGPRSIQRFYLNFNFLLSSVRHLLCCMSIVNMQGCSGLALSAAVAHMVPVRGRALTVASMRMTKLVRRELVPRPLSKKMPPRKGRKKRSMIAWENPSACSQ